MAVSKAGQREPVVDGIRWDGSLAKDCIILVTWIGIGLLRGVKSVESSRTSLTNLDASNHSPSREAKFPAGMVDEDGHYSSARWVETGRRSIPQELES